MNGHARRPFVVLHGSGPSCCSSCDAITIHFPDDAEVHIVGRASTPERLARRLQRFFATCIESPTLVAELASGRVAALPSGLAKGRDA